MTLLSQSCIALFGMALTLSAAADPDRCAKPETLDLNATLTVDAGRIPGTGQRKPASALPLVRVEIVLGAPEGIQLEALTGVDLFDASGRALRLAAERGQPGTFAGSVPPGIYLMRPFVVESATIPARSLVAPARRVVLDQDENDVYVHLAERGRPFFRIGSGIVPFAPSQFTAVTRAGGSAPDTVMLRTIDAVAAEQHLSRTTLGAPAQRPAAAILIDTPARADRQRLVEALRERLGSSVRVGMAINVGKRSMQILDNQYVVRFSPGVTQLARERVASLSGIVLLKAYEPDRDLWLVRFKNDSYLSSLATLNCLVEEGILLTGEPDLVRTFHSEAAPRSWPDDPRYPDQNDPTVKANHANQNVRGAWDLLFDQSRNSVASSAVRIGVLDLVIDPADGELNCLVDGAPQIAMCWDPARLLTAGSGQCVSPLNEPGETHGMMMLGIIAACTNNGVGVAGIAPGARINAVAMGSWEQSYWGSGDYGDLLRWMAGLKTPCPTAASGGEHPCRWQTTESHVINNSYTMDKGESWHGEKVELPEVVASAFEALTKHGRNGKGTVLVYAAGNWDPTYPTKIISPLAADHRTIAVSNCFVDSNGERLYRGEIPGHFGSNFGHKIDVCADGEKSETIHSGCPTFTPAQPCVIGGTSAATATVTAIVALMLTANPDLTWKQVRRLLRDSADKIDMGQTDAVGRWVNGESKWYGAGRVNAAAAVQAAIDARPP